MIRTEKDFLKTVSGGFKACYILRGEPGVGKSTLANKIKDIIKCAEICEADQYFTRPDGYYDFNFRLLSNAHSWCFNKFAGLIDNWVPVIVSNTNTRLKEFQKYIDTAEEEGYKVFVVRLLTNYGNVHGVPEEKVDEMRDRIENHEGEILIK